MSERRPRRVFVNHHLFTQTDVDSGSLTMLGTVIHRFPEPGEYLGVAERGGETRSFRLTVDATSPSQQTNIDLSSLEPGDGGGSDCGCKPGDAAPDRAFVVNPAGYVVFHVSRGSGGYVVRVGRVDKQDEAVFDSVRLDGDDLFAVTLIRPGTYAVRNPISGAHGEIAVAYPKAGKQAYRPSEPVTIECTDKGFRPAKIKLQAAQGQVYRFGTPSRIQIELVAPDDGPAGGEPPKGPRRTRTKPRRQA